MYYLLFTIVILILFLLFKIYKSKGRELFDSHTSNQGQRQVQEPISDENGRRLLLSQSIFL